MTKKSTPNVLGYLLYYKDKRDRTALCFPEEVQGDNDFSKFLYRSVESAHRDIQENYFDVNKTYHIVPVVEYVPTLDELTAVCYKKKVYFGVEGMKNLAALKRKEALAGKKKTQKG